ncbi:hypothetical protein [Corynebacterium propinquum]|uniref:hypothetical protein n=1 Tax=Corynebacterium propinquum TaxID=43769 RepID=UPI000665F1ED|nr:hypothetical protein [Corynebacterium propinquum]
MWFPLVVVVSAAVLSASATISAGRSTPKHPSVERPSKISVFAFAIATVLYAASGVLLVQERIAFAIGLAIAGFVVFAVGYGVSQKKS